MKPKKKTQYACTDCGHVVYQWLGKCPECGAWNSFQEETILPPSAYAAIESSAQSVEVTSRVFRLDEIPEHETQRNPTGCSEFDRVLGGGIIPGSTILMAGEPGIGKSTLLLQAAHSLCDFFRKQMKAEASVFYLAAEESAENIKHRATRLGISGPSFRVAAETDLQRALSFFEKDPPKLIIIDSIQAVYHAEYPSPPGSVTQVRECAIRLCHYARQRQVAVIFVGHVTKEGLLAGPKALEHLVDTVVYFEGERYDELRMVRAVKNRHGSTGEIGLFEMTTQGLKEIANPSRFFVSDGEELFPGRATVCMVEGQRPFLVEIQALENSTSYNNPLRRSVGLDLNKISLLIAVIEKVLGIRLSQYDVFIKVPGGMILQDPAVDLALIVAILSSVFEKTVPAGTVFLGEVGLNGEVRKCRQLDIRLKEMQRLGVKHIVLPAGQKPKEALKVSSTPIRSIREVHSRFFSA